MKSPRAIAWSTNSHCASSRTAIDDLPKEDSGSRRTSTPRSRSRAGYRFEGSSYPRAEAYTMTR